LGPLWPQRWGGYLLGAGEPGVGGTEFWLSGGTPHRAGGGGGFPGGGSGSALDYGPGVYAEQKVPWTLPANKTQTGVLTRSTSGGHYETANAIRFEDKKGAEEIWFHAEKNYRTEVENSETKSVGADRSKTIGGNETTSVKGNRSETVGKNETITVQGNRTETVSGAQTETITKDLTITVTDGGQTNTVKKAISIESSEANILIKASTEILLQVGSSTLRLTPENIKLLASRIDLNE